MPGAQRSHRHKGRRIVVRVIAAILVIAALLFAALLGIIFVPTHVPATAPVDKPVSAVKHYYLALGDSLAFGFQPNFNWDQGYAMQWWSELQRHGSKSFLDYGCNAETSAQFIHDGCPTARLRHNYFTGSQLHAAVDFIRGHRGQVGPVSLDEGADDVLPYINTQSCTVDVPRFKVALAKLEQRLTTVILPQLIHALAGPNGKPTGQLVMMTYYDPFARKCTDAHRFIRLLNTRLTHAAARFHVPLVDVYAAFTQHVHTDATICRYTWMCSIFHSIHPNTTGYAVITHAFEQRTGY